VQYRRVGPQPGLAEKSIGTHETHALAVMCDTFYPLRLTKFAKDLDDGRYTYSWYENAQEGADQMKPPWTATRAAPASPLTSRAAPL
jgi:hypothetical protein